MLLDCISWAKPLQHTKMSNLMPFLEKNLSKIELSRILA